MSRTLWGKMNICEGKKLRLEIALSLNRGTWVRIPPSPPIIFQEYSCLDDALLKMNP